MQARLQPALFCPCGETPSGSSLCRRCAQHQADSRRRFGGEREAVLRRDRYRCTVCHQNDERLHVHHRRRGCHQRRWLTTVCAACHARLHRTAAIRSGWLPPFLIELWSEQHPGVPVQLQFPEAQ